MRCACSMAALSGLVVSAASEFSEAEAFVDFAGLDWLLPLYRLRRSPPGCRRPALTAPGIAGACCVAKDVLSQNRLSNLEPNSLPSFKDRERVRRPFMQLLIAVPEARLCPKRKGLRLALQQLGAKASETGAEELNRACSDQCLSFLFCPDRTPGMSQGRRSIQLNQVLCRVWVKLRRTHSEHMSSAVH